PCRLAIAGTTGTAWALARSPLGQDFTILAPSEERAALQHLPVAGLRLDPRMVARLRRLGLRSVGELARLPRAEITARFGTLPVLRLDQALGTVEEAIAWPRPPAPFTERFSSAEPIGTPEDLGRALELLAARLCQRLAEQRQGGHRFVARFFRVDGQDQYIAVTTALPAREPAHLTKLLRERLETVDPGFGVETVALDAEEVAPLGTPQGKLLAAPDPGRALAEMVDTLANRIGEGRIWRPAPQESHVPERAVRPAPPLAAAPSWTTDPSAPRPIRLLRRPEPIEATAPVPDDPPILFRWRGALHRVCAASGPERIGAEWWRRAESQDDRPVADMLRDYYRVEDTAGARFWVFRAGLEAQRMPRWYLHGLFA
ncbi:MAG TPA: DNA polymerase Y family protein, partial [Acetobacteraceae bacterium]|nr:DNA polymerase Y family protein [Acetobacteraceae bacterium]